MENKKVSLIERLSDLGKKLIINVCSAIFIIYFFGFYGLAIAVNNREQREKDGDFYLTILIFNFVALSLTGLLISKFI
jgi:hypothetical protein